MLQRYSQLLCIAQKVRNRVSSCNNCVNLGNSLQVQGIKEHTWGYLINLSHSKYEITQFQIHVSMKFIFEESLKWPVSTAVQVHFWKFYSDLIIISLENL